MIRYIGRQTLHWHLVHQVLQDPSQLQSRALTGMDHRYRGLDLLLHGCPAEVDAQKQKLTRCEVPLDLLDHDRGTGGPAGLARDPQGDECGVPGRLRQQSYEGRLIDRQGQRLDTTPVDDRRYFALPAKASARHLAYL